MVEGISNGTLADQGNNGQIETTQNPVSTEQPLSMIERAEKVKAEIEAIEKRFDEQMKRNEEILSRMIMGGKSNAGQISKSPEQQLDAQIKEESDKIVGAFHRAPPTYRG